MPGIDITKEAVRASGLPIERIKHLIGEPHEKIVKELGRFGPQYVRRYKIWRKYLEKTISGELKEPLVIVVAGLPGTGKTTLASEIAKSLGIRVMMGGDALREFLRGILKKEEHPVLFTSVYNTWQYFSDKPTKDSIIKGYEEQSRIMNKCMGKLMERCVRDGENMVIEYLHFLPHTFESDILKKRNIIPMVLHIDDIEKHKERILSRNEFAHIKSDPQRLINQLDKYRIMQDRLLEKAKEWDIPIIKNEDFHQTLEQALDVIMDRVAKLVGEK
ncbi:MAG: AAA family ATPase [Candidatus Diapherotrites archaeon]|nr:AAA family ATPase [Candidatus Diapherotrites archaeon]